MLLLLPVAFAVPAWNWSATPVSFHTEAVLEQSYGVVLKAKNNLDARAVVVGVADEYSCTGAPAEKTVVVTCTLGWVNLKARAKVENEVEILNRLLEEWSTDLPTYQVVMEFSPNGKMQQLNLSGTHPANLRERDVLEQQRALLLRVFCGFDLAFPEKDTQYAKGWVQKGWQPMFTVIVRPL